MIGNTMADHHHTKGHLVKPGVAESTCSCGHRWTHDTSWMEKYRDMLKPE